MNLLKSYGVAFILLIGIASIPIMQFVIDVNADPLEYNQELHDKWLILDGTKSTIWKPLYINKNNIDSIQINKEHKSNKDKKGYNITIWINNQIYEVYLYSLESLIPKYDNIFADGTWIKY